MQQKNNISNLDEIFSLLEKHDNILRHLIAVRIELRLLGVSLTPLNDTATTSGILPTPTPKAQEHAQCSIA